MKLLVTILILTAAFLLESRAFETASAQLDSTALPPLKAVIAKVLERAQQEDQNDRAFQAGYAYKRTKTTEERDGDGKLEKRQERTSQHFPKPSKGRLVQATNSAAVGKDASDSRPSARKQPYEKKDFPLNQELLDHFQFKIAGREMLNDRLTLAVDFQPARKDLPVKSLKDHFLNKVAGRLWVDEADFALAKADIHLTHPVNIVGGLAGSVKGLAYRFERERTPEGVWFTKNVKWHVEAREFLASKKIDYSEEARDVRRVK